MSARVLSFRVVTAGVLLALGWAGTAAVAYVLPGTSILRRTADRREAVSTTSHRVTGTLVLGGEAARTAAVPLGMSPERPDLQVDAVLSLKLPGRCRLEVASPTGQPVASSQSQGKRRFEGTEVQAITVAVHAMCGVLATRTGDVGDTRAAIDRSLAAWKVAPKTSSLARFGGQVAYVLGDLSETASQFWVYKDTFQPARVRLTDTAGVVWDVRFLDYGSPVMGESFPRVIEVFRAGEPALRFSAVTADARPNLPDKLF